jgi:DNA-binding protein HU-beta
MNKSELIDAIAAKADLPKNKAAAALDAFTKSITEALTAGDSVTLTGFGVFSVNSRAARTGRNPQTGEVVEISARKAPGFKPGKALKAAVS